MNEYDVIINVSFIYKFVLLYKYESIKEEA